MAAFFGGSGRHCGSGKHGGKEGAEGGTRKQTRD
jgi:hypothetical protein